MTDVWREELIAAISKAMHALTMTYPQDSRPSFPALAEAALAAVLPLIEEHERAGWKQVGVQYRWLSPNSEVGTWNMVADEAGLPDVKPGAWRWESRPVYVRELEPQPDETEQR